MKIIKRNIVGHVLQPVDFIEEGTPIKEITTLTGGSVTFQVLSGNYEGLEIKDSNGKVMRIQTELIKFTQVEPNAEVPFSGSTQDLKDLLKEFFFFDVNPASASSVIPLEYCRKMSQTATYPIVAGALTQLKMRPSILNEHVATSSEIMETVTATKVVGQVFKASKDNINGIFLALESAEGESEIDDIEQVDDATLQAQWVLGGDTVNLALLDTLIFSPNNGSTKSMKLNFEKFDTWIKTIALTDFANATVEFDYRQTISSTDATMTLSIGDGVNFSSITIPMPAILINSWQHLSIPSDAFEGVANMAAITQIKFEVVSKKINESAYVDNIRLRPSPGSIEIELWDFGTTLPANNGTVDYTTFTQYTTIGDLGISSALASSVSISLRGGPQVYRVPQFAAGPAKENPNNSLLTIGNYYAIVLKYIDTNVSVFGPDTTFAVDRYINGYGWKAETADNLIDVIPGAFGAGAYSNLLYIGETIR